MVAHTSNGAEKGSCIAIAGVKVRAARIGVFGGPFQGALTLLLERLLKRLSHILPLNDRSGYVLMTYDKNLCRSPACLYLFLAQKPTRA